MPIMAGRPCAAGVFYVRRDLQDRLAPQAFGWNNGVPQLRGTGDDEFACDARRYEAGSFNILDCWPQCCACYCLRARRHRR